MLQSLSRSPSLFYLVFLFLSLSLTFPQFLSPPHSLFSQSLSKLSLSPSLVYFLSLSLPKSLFPVCLFQFLSLSSCLFHSQSLTFSSSLFHSQCLTFFSSLSPSLSQSLTHFPFPISTIAQVSVSTVFLSLIYSDALLFSTLGGHLLLQRMTLHG